MEKYKFSTPKWFGAKRRHFKVQCGGPKGVFTLVFFGTGSVSQEKLYQVLEHVFGNYPDANIIHHKNIKMKAKAQELSVKGKPDKKIQLPEGKFVQPACVEVQLPKANKRVIKTTIAKTLDLVDRTLGKLVGSGLSS